MQHEVELPTITGGTNPVPGQGQILHRDHRRWMVALVCSSALLDSLSKPRQHRALRPLPTADHRCSATSKEQLEVKRACARSSLQQRVEGA